MTARKYRLVSELSKEQKSYLAGLRGQAKIVAEELAADTTPRLAEDINALTGPRLVTRQDTLRVTLYYIIVFKGKGIVEALENRPAAPENGFAGVLDAAGEIPAAE